MTSIIHFYRAEDEFGCFSNFSSHAIYLDKRRWPTSEHYFQAMKFLDRKNQELIRSAKTPGLAARLGRDRKRPLRRDWESVKYGIMRQAVLTKFTQHDDLREILLATGDARLVEHTANDRIWGDGGDGSGSNWLGRILMEVRATLSDAD